MLIVRAYPVMGRLVVEVTCTHAEGVAAPHLLLRTRVAGEADDVYEALSEVVGTLQWLMDEVRAGEVETYDDCVL